MKNKNIKEFWENRVRQYDSSSSFSVTNLEEDPILQEVKTEKEREKIENLFSLTDDSILLDLGSGIGYWSLIFAPKCKQVIGVDFIEQMNQIAVTRAKKQKIKNVKFYTSDIVGFTPRIKFDFVFMSGVLLYLTDNNATELIKKIHSYTHKDAKIILRDSTGIKERFVIQNKYSANLESTYNAIYRSKSEIIELFASNEFSLLHDDDMFETGSPLNKWDETRLRVYLFKRV